MLRFRLAFAFAAGALAASAQQYTITTFAGTGGSPGYAGDYGPASSAQFNTPFALARDSNGNLYISDLGNYVVRKIDANGTVTTFAGNNSFGFSGDGGPAYAAQISNVNGIAVDAKGNVYLADTLNGRVRIVTPDGKINTFAGNGTRGYAGDGGPAVNSVLYYPSGVAVDPQGNVYIADYGAAVVRKVDTNGFISTVAGTGTSIFGAVLGDGGPAKQAPLSMPWSVAVDGAGNVYIGDLGSGAIRRVAGNGIISTLAANTPAENLAVDNSTAIYYSNYSNSTVLKRYSDGTTVTIAGTAGQPGYSGDGGPATLAQLSAPYGVALDPSSGNVYVADSKNAVIRELSPGPYFISSVANAAGNIGFANISGGNSSPAIAPGEIISIFGSGLGPTNLVLNAPQNGVFGTSLAGVIVTVNGILAPIIFTSWNQTVVVVPYGIEGSGSVNIAVGYQGNAPLIIGVPVAATAPGIFTHNASGSGQAAAVNADGTINSATNPVPAGGYISLYVTGEGQTTPGGSDGRISGANPPKPNASVSVTIGGQPANVTYAGEAPMEIAGLMQINVQVPPGIAANSAVPVVVNIGGVSSQSTATIAVSAP